MDDYSRFIWVKFLASNDEAPDFIIKFLKMIKVRLNATVRNIRTDNGTEFVNQTLRNYYESVGISYETSVARSPQKKWWLLIRRNAILLLKPLTQCYSTQKASIYFYGQRQSLPHVTPKNDPLYDFAMEKLLMSSYMTLGKLQAKSDIADGNAFEEFCSGTRGFNIDPTTSSSGLVSNPIPQQPCSPSQRDDWDRLFQPMFDEYFNPPTIAISPVPVANALRTVDLADSKTLCVSHVKLTRFSLTSIPIITSSRTFSICSYGLKNHPKHTFFHEDQLHEISS
ncbi:retrovirus-related pol polyprotein from transposon TNT 1-94 [Tanacetum coccineum]|uniref:Retrovirus-related pol polyprotein from transposon TNT 1-94 n=1 Tax=Tanacetum coccineum TaxID=301880 RepID=A0ABQ4ZCD8_9ASTR